MRFERSIWRRSLAHKVYPVAFLNDFCDIIFGDLSRCLGFYKLRLQLFIINVAKNTKSNNYALPCRLPFAKHSFLVIMRGIRGLTLFFRHILLFSFFLRLFQWCGLRLSEPFVPWTTYQNLSGRCSSGLRWLLYKVIRCLE
jgi:hypothetical protein